jgi:hypothetical protein
MSGLVQQYNNPDGGMRTTDHLRQIEARLDLAVEFSTDHHEVRVLGLQAPKKIGRRNSECRAIPLACKSVCKQVACH